MIVKLSEMKKYLRVDFADDNKVIRTLISSAEDICRNILRADSLDEYTDNENVRVAVMYAVAYLYEHREEADHQELMLTLRALLSEIREEAF
jgi:uncharacterized phage protein (predicted DNA packaging)